MQFTLTYDGPLKASGRSAPDKHAIREKLHPQIKKLWTLPPLVNGRRVVDINPSDHDSGIALTTTDGHQFAAVVFSKLFLRAKLQIRMFRREPPGKLTHGGDIDNRLKTLLDALQTPRYAQEIPAGWSPTVDQSPLHCLLEDDRQVTRLDVDTVRWLAPGDFDEVRLIIDVDVWTPEPTLWSQAFI